MKAVLLALLLPALVLAETPKTVTPEEAQTCQAVGYLQLTIVKRAIFNVYPGFDPEGTADEQFIAAVAVQSAFTGREWCLNGTMDKYNDMYKKAEAEKESICPITQIWFTDLLNEAEGRTLKVKDNLTGPLAFLAVKKEVLA